MSPVLSRNKWQAWLNVFLDKLGIVHMVVDDNNDDPVAPPSGFTGKRILFWPNGMLKSVIHYTGGIENGDALCVWDNGKTCQIGSNINGDASGQWKDYSQDGCLQKITNFLNGYVIDSKVFYKNGRVMEEKAYLNGKLEGRSTWYSVDGDIRATGIYKDGAPSDGMFIMVDYSSDRTGGLRIIERVVLYRNGSECVGS